MALNISETREQWRCLKRECRQDIQLRSGTWLDNSRLHCDKVLTFIYSWSFKLTSVAFSERELGGGPGLTFEIDESVLNRNLMLAVLSNNSGFSLAFAGEKTLSFVCC